MLKGLKMAKERNEETYPVRSLHDFLFELDKEWSKFRNGSLIALISSALMFVFVVFLILIVRRLPRPTFGDLVFLLVAGGLLAYSIYATYAQYRFFNKWERRIGLLMHLEDELIAEKLGDKSQS
jgi:hypothetical protein